MANLLNITTKVMNKKKTTPAKQPTQQEINNDYRQDVIQLELKSRYWKAQFEIRHYTLEAEKLQAEYDTWLLRQREKEEKAMQEYLSKIEEMEKAAQQGEIEVKSE